MHNKNPYLIYFSPQIVAIFLLGIASGLPFLLILATMHVWLYETGINKQIIGLFAFVSIPYSLKFIIAPIITQLKIPILGKILGNCRGWLLISQLMIIIFLIIIAHLNPAINIYLIAICALIIGIFSAIQDILVESYRIDILPTKIIGCGISASMLGYRLGMWLAGAIGLYIAHYFSWKKMYIFMAICMLTGIVTTMLIKFNNVKSENALFSINNFKLKFYIKNLQNALRQTWQQLAVRSDIILVIAYIIIFKLIDAGLNVMTSPFLLDIGFSKVVIAHIGKSLGISAVIVGGIIASILLLKYELKNLLLFCSFLYSIATITFLIQNYYGNSIPILCVTVLFENLVNGIGYTIFLTYISLICKGENSAVSFAFLTSLSSLIRVLSSYFFGSLAHYSTWNKYYLFVFCLCILCSILLISKRHLILK